MPSAQTYFQLELQRTQFREEPSSSRFEEIQPPSGFMNESQPQIRRQYDCSPTSDPSSIEDGDESALNRPSTQLLKPARSPRTFEARKTALNDTTVRSDQTPVNWKALLPLFMIRTADAMTYTTIFSFIVEYITTILQNQDHPNGALTSDSDKIGLYAGLAEGSFMLTQAAMAPFWARMADRYGRKRSLILGFAGTVLCAAFVGFGGSVGWVIFWRATFGLNPVPVVVRVMITELTDLSNRPFVFSSYSPVFHCGYIMGHLAGGLLSKPYGRLPAFLGGEVELFQKWPYGLPGIATAIFGVLSLIVGQIWLPETKPVNTNHQMGRTSKERSLRELLVEVVKIPHFLTVLYGFCAYQLAVNAFMGFFTLMTYTAVEQGGLGFPVSIIGVMSACSTVLYLIFSPMIIPLLNRRLNARDSLSVVVAALPVESLIVPIAQAAATQGRMWTWSMLAVQLPLYNYHLIGWSLNDTWVAACFEYFPELLASGSAFVMIAGVVGRGLGPVISGWLFSSATQYKVGSLGRQIAWLGLLVLTLPPLILSRRLPADINAQHREVCIHRKTGRTDGHEGEEEEVGLMGRG